jgi:hypothetical protein
VKKLLVALGGATLSLAPKRCVAISDDFETVGYFGSGGIGFTGITDITTFNNRIYTIERDYTISEFNTDGSEHMRRSIRHLFTEDDRIDYVAYDGRYFYVLVSNDSAGYESIRLVKISQSLRLKDQVSLPSGHYCGLASVSNGIVRSVIRNQFGVTRPTVIDIDTEHKQISRTEINTYSNVKGYVHSRGTDLISVSSTGQREANQILRVKGETVESMLEVGIDEPIAAMTLTKRGLVCWLESASMITVENNTVTRKPYPDTFTVGDYGGQIISCIQMSSTDNDQVVICDNWSVGVLNSRLDIKYKFGNTDSSGTGEPIAAVNANGQVVIGKFGYLTIIRSKGKVIHVPITSNSGVPMRASAVTIDNDGTVFAAYMNEASIFGSLVEPTIVRIDKTANRVSAKLRLSDAYISDIVVVKELYFISNGALYELSPNLNSKPKHIPLPYAAVDLSVQNGFLYVLSNQPSVLKINPRQRQLVDTMYVNYLFRLSDLLGAIWFFDVRPDESIIVDVFGQVTLGGIETGHYRLTDPLGNGSSKYIISIKDVVKVTKYRSL